MFVLPSTTIVNRVIPKNAFDAYTNSKQRKIFSANIDKIRWTNKLSTQTIKLEGKDVQEIQIFHVHLKQKYEVEDVLTIIDKHIPYHIIFILSFEDEVLLSAAQKHLHPTIDNTSVIDWRFTSTWFHAENSPFQLNLKSSLDDVFADFCFQLLGKTKSISLQEVIILEQSRKQLLYEIDRLESEIKRCKQFNLKVELNMQLQSKKKALSDLG